MNNQWDEISQAYFSGVKADKNADFAYERLVNSLSLLSLCDTGNKILDLGCGDGRFTKDLEARFSQVYAIDYSSKMLEQAKKLCKLTKFFQYNLENTFPKFNTKFDVIVCKLLLMYIHNLDNIAENSYKYLNSNGALIISITHPLKWITQSNYHGYLQEIDIKSTIAHLKTIPVAFLNRTLQTYINTFAKFGFVLQTIIETGVPDSFVIKFPQYRAFQYKPYRLNLKFVKI